MDAVELFDELSGLCADAEEIICEVNTEEDCSVHECARELRGILYSMLRLLKARGLGS